MSAKNCLSAVLLFLLAACLVGCSANQNAAAISTSTPGPLASSIPPTSTIPQPSPTYAIGKYAFPATIDPTSRYLFYLHGKIIEDQGLPAVSPDFGEYEYAAILEKLASYGFVVISEQRQKDTDSFVYAQRVVDQVTTLLNAGVPPDKITVVGASKGGGITILVSNLLANAQLNYVILSICSPETVQELEQSGVYLYGNVLSIYDTWDELAGSCLEYFLYSQGNGLSKHQEIALDLGLGHGMLYKPLEDWILPVVQWAGNP